MPGGSAGPAPARTWTSHLLPAPPSIRVQGLQQATWPEAFAAIQKAVAGVKGGEMRAIAGKLADAGEVAGVGQGVEWAGCEGPNHACEVLAGLAFGCGSPQQEHCSAHLGYLFSTCPHLLPAPTPESMVALKDLFNRLGAGDLRVSCGLKQFMRRGHWRCLADARECQCSWLQTGRTGHLMAHSATCAAWLEA